MQDSYTSALQTIGLFGLKLHRFPAMVGMMTFFVVCVSSYHVHRCSLIDIVSAQVVRYGRTRTENVHSQCVYLFCSSVPFQSGSMSPSIQR